MSEQELETLEYEFISDRDCMRIYHATFEGRARETLSTINPKYAEIEAKKIKAEKRAKAFENKPEPKRRYI